MMNEEEYKRELIRMWDSLRDDYKGENSCRGVICRKCPLRDILVDDIGCGNSIYAVKTINIVEKWSKEHPQKHKVSQLEYDILEQYANRGFACYFLEYDLLMSLLKKGYFKGADEKMNINYYFNNCEVEYDR